MKFGYLAILLLFLNLAAFAQTKGDRGYRVKVGDPEAKIFTQFAYKGAGVTRNVVIDPTGRIVFLTRLYISNEFNAMKEKLASMLSGK